MLVAAEERQAVLPGQGRNPDVVPGYRAAAAFQFVADLWIVSGRSFVHHQPSATRERFRQPSFIPRTVARLPDAIVEFAQHDCRDRDLIRPLFTSPSAMADNPFVPRITANPRARSGQIPPQ